MTLIVCIVTKRVSRQTITSVKVNGRKHTGYCINYDLLKNGDALNVATQ